MFTRQSDVRKRGHVVPMFTRQSDVRKEGHIVPMFTRQLDVRKDGHIFPMFTRQSDVRKIDSEQWNISLLSEDRSLLSLASSYWQELYEAYADNTLFSQSLLVMNS